VKIAVASGKGGTGKTTVSTCLAALLAESQPVALVDLDVEEPNTQLFLNGQLVHEDLVPKHIPRWEPEPCTNCGLCQTVCNFGAFLSLPDEVMVFPELCHACFACSELCPEDALPMQAIPMGVLRHAEHQDLALMESRLDIGQEQAVPLIKTTLDYLAATIPDTTLTILDAPPGTSCPVIAATRHADLVVLVTEPTPFGLHDLSLAVETVRLLGRPMLVVINRHGLGDDAVERYCQAEGLQVAARIPHSREVAGLYAQGKLPLDVPEFRQALEQLAAVVISRQEGGSA